ncbi:proteasome-interacting protein cic1 [Polyrhizophydium stewartii]|uniref:Proteasome-interacting protein cic1 n=1 Tax=Polyrhizophydium stewartii TaxID=2732419 RepID=A0ABR4N510_9FUNG|nr:hypothetical protein HK105_008082 [Polyrhizophydium stewartii]
MKSAIDEQQVSKATKALLAHMRKHRAEKKDSKKAQLDVEGERADADVIWVVIATKKMPEKLRIKPVPIPLSHPLLPEDAEVCLITKDPQREYKDLMQNNGVTRVSRVIGVSKLKAKFKPYEAKRQLRSSYKLFLADERVLPLLPPILGKTFFAKKKHPVPVDLTKKNVKAEIERAINATYLNFNKGACNSIKAGHLNLDLAQNVQNILDVVRGAAEKIPGKWNNIQAVHIKSSTSIALPVYNALPHDPIDDPEDDQGASPDSATEASGEEADDE